MKKLKTVYNTNKAIEAVISNNKAEISLENLTIAGYYEAPIRNGVSGLALADYVGRTTIEELAGGIPEHEYCDTEIMSSLIDGKSLDPVDLIESGYLKISRYDLSRSGDGSLGLIARLDSDLVNDGTEFISDSLDFIHDERLKNSENKSICEILLAEKTLVRMDPENVTSVMNTSLCAKAKRNAYIITNNTGFAKMDVKDEYGNNLVKKTSDGRFIYNEKYEILEIEDAILPNLTSGSPIIAGDIAGACTLLCYGSTRTLDKDTAIVYDRRFIDTESAIRLTKSDKCYIVGYLA